ncbi:MAG TPA: class I SAM-dependent methyltransferase [Candidatus Acidoferrum sp.]|nr:class I SAM-dependent methyltransferase [Candidatus Acidoferrum sp.]
MSLATADPIRPAQNLPRRAAAPQAPEDCYEDRLKQIIRPGDRILDAGCGTGKYFRASFARAAGCRLVGVDIQENLKSNSGIDFGVCADLQNLPFPDGSFEVVNCRLAIEHVKTPEAALREFYRILKPAGRLAVFTSNLLHYYGVASSLTPHWFHVWFNSRVRGFESADIFPTYYRANTQHRLQALFRKSGFGRAEVTLVEGAPSVLAFNSLLLSLGRAYERLVNRHESLSRFRMNIIAVAYKL